MGFEERLALLVDAEQNCRKSNMLTRSIRKARFATPGAVIEHIEYNEDHHLDKAQILQLATCGLISKYHLLILDKWLIRYPMPQESCNLLEVIEARCSKGSIIFCTQYEPGDWYRRRAYTNPSKTLEHTYNTAAAQSCPYAAFAVGLLNLGGTITHFRQLRCFFRTAYSRTGLQ